MTNYAGMDVEAVRSLGAELQRVVAELAERSRAIGVRIAEIDWVGDDAQAFKEEWWPRHAKALGRALTEVHGLGQSAKNNADEQQGGSRASGGGVNGGGAVGGGSPVVGGAPVVGGGSELSGASLASNAPLDSAQKIYLDAIATGRMGTYGIGGASQYQCTAWAYARWMSLGWDGTPGSGHGGVLAGKFGGTTDTIPTFGAMASYGGGEYGHVMIVEEVSRNEQGFLQVRVSEFNTDSNPNSASLNEFKSSAVMTQDAQGNWIKNGINRGKVTFATFPG